MMGRSYFISHILQSQYNVSSGILPQVHRTQIQKTGSLVRQGSRRTIIIGMEKEKLTFRIYLKSISLFLSFFHSVLKNISGTFLIRCPVRLINIADKSGYLSLLGSPWKNAESIQIRVEVHILLFVSIEALHRRSIDHTFIIHSLFQLAERNRNILHGTEHIGKLKTDKFHVFFLCHMQNILSGVFRHNDHHVLSELINNPA